MSRTIRKISTFGNRTAKSEKKDKMRWNKAMRRYNNACIFQGKELPDRIRTITNRWENRKDSKHYR